MQCPRCQVDNRESAQFCRECGAPLGLVCPGCGAEIDAPSKFCDVCGTALAAPAPVSPASQFASPGRYTPRHLAEKILTSRASLEGERKQVTVLFVDVVGSTSLSERMDPEELHGLMTRAFELMLAEVHRYEGTVNQFLGDGIMALFGAPIAHEDHASRAVHAALHIRRVMAEYEGDLRRRRGISFQVRQGLNTGLVVVGSIGNDLRMDYTAVGDTTNVAARLQQTAAAGRIVIADTTNRLVEGYFLTRSLGQSFVKGKAEPVTAWEVISARVARTRLEVEAERGLTPFVAREKELRLLLEAFEKARAGQGQVVFLVGEAGIGKSRLLLEFRRRLGEAVTWLEGHAVSFGSSMALHPLVDLLKRNFRIEDGDSEETMLAKLERGVLILGEDLRPMLPYLRYLLSLPPGDAAVSALDPKQRRAAIVDALRRLLVRAAEVHPQVLVYEDVHWMDKATEELLLSTVDVIPGNRVLQILSCRTGYTHPFGERSYHTRIGLDVLSPEDSVEMARAMLAVERLPTELEALVARKAEGNPFFVEEVVKSLRETEAIRPAGHSYVLARQLDQIVVPDRIQDVIMARIDRLQEEPKRALQIASVIGRDFTRRLLERVSGEILVSVEEALAQLQSLEFVYEKSLVPELSYTFRHALTQEVTYHSLLLRRRQELHRLIGAALEEMYTDRLAEQYEVLAHHFLRGDEPAKALAYLLKAGEKAAKAFANREARVLYEQALGRLPSEALSERADVMKTLATVTQYLGDADASLRYAEAAVDLYERLNDKRNAVAMHLHIDVLFSWQWDGAREDWGLKHLEAAAGLVEQDPDSVEKGLVYQRTAHRYLHRSQPRTTVAWAQRAVDMFARLGVSMGTSLGTALIATGRIEEGVAYSEKNWEPVRKAGIPVVMAVFGHELALTLALARDIPRSRRWGEAVLPEVVKSSQVFEAMLRRPLTLTYALSGEIEKAAETCRVIEEIEAKTLLGCVYEDASGVGLYHLRRGELEQARGYLERVMPLYQARSNLTAVAACALMLGHVSLELADYPRAEELLMTSLDIAQSGGNVLLQAWILPLLSELYLTSDQLEKATDHLRRGFELLSPDRNWYGLAAPVHAMQGRLASALRNWDEAARSLEAAIAINRQYQLPWDEGRALRDLACTYLARDEAGDRERGLHGLEQAAQIFQRVGARKEVERTLARKEVAQA